MSAVLEAPRRKRVAAGASRTSMVEQDQLTTVWDTSWATYLNIDSSVQGTRTRAAFLQGRLDLMTLSIDHERIKGNLAHLIASHCLDEEIEFSTQGAATLRIPKDRAKEPDDSFVFGDLKKTRPDMVLEVVLTSGAMDKLEFYAPFHIPEVWIWESASLQVHMLDGGRYKKVKKSRLLPKFDIALAGSLATCQSTSQAVREFRKKR